MKFLCLHGMGTSSAILKVQLGPICAQLRSLGHEFVFVEGTVSCDQPGAIKTFFPGPYRCFYTLPQYKQLASAKKLVEDAMDRHGPFDGVIGFSQGAALASALILDHSIENPYDDLFSLAVFIGASMPFDLREGEVEPDVEGASDPGTTPDAELPFFGRTDLQVRHTPERDVSLRIRVPTVHIIGDIDEYAGQSRKLARMCTENPITVGHREGHWIPRDVRFTKKAVTAIQQVVEDIESTN